MLTSSNRLMKPRGDEIDVYFYPNKIGLFSAGFVFLVIAILVFYYTWVEPIGPKFGGGSSDRFGGPAPYYITKFLGLPALGIICFYSFRTALTKGKVVELRVGVDGIWRRALTGVETFIPWTEITQITIEKSKLDKLLVFHVTDSKKYPALTLGHNGIYLTEGSSPLPLEDLAQKFCKFVPFQERYQSCKAIEKSPTK